MTRKPEPGAADPAAAGQPIGGGRRRRPEPTPAQRALGLLVRREHSRRELERKLEARGIDRDDAVAAVERMAAEGWQDDVRFATSMARSRAASGRGPLHIRAELRSHGLDSGTVETAMAGLAESGEDDWLANARALVERRYGGGCANDPALRRKAADFLCRRGFDAATAHAAARLEDSDS